MSVTSRALLFLLSAAVVTNSTSGHGQGCELLVPESVKHHREPEQEPLVININYAIFGVRDVPTSGGSITIEFG